MKIQIHTAGNLSIVKPLKDQATVGNSGDEIAGSREGNQVYKGGGSFENMRNPDFQAFEDQLLSAHGTPTPAGTPALAH